MNGYRIKQTIFIIIGLLAGLWTGNFTEHALARTFGEKLAKKAYHDQLKSGELKQSDPFFKSEVDKATLTYEEDFKKYTFDILLIHILVYGVTCAIGVFVGVCVAEATGGERDGDVGMKRGKGADEN